MTVIQAEEQYKQYKKVETFLETLQSYEHLCSSISLDPNLQGLASFHFLKSKLQFEEAKKLWALLEKKEKLAEYHKDNGELACCDKEVLIVGAGPCGLRMAIECAFLGARVTVIDMRAYISRNNVLHLWPFVIQDVKALGGKIFNPKFCVGAIDHVSIKRLQLMLMKIALILGVKIHTPVQFQQILEPNQDHRWRVRVDPDDHPVNKTDFDFIVGANGKNNSLPDFSRKTMRGKLAIAITANFINNKSTPDAKVVEIGGLSYIFDQEFFNGLKRKTGGDLENFVYFKDDTHYFVMTPKKACLLTQGVLKQDYTDAKKLLAADNINQERLRSFTRDIAMVSTNNQLPTTEYARNHHSVEDLAIFDFTAISMANHSVYVKEYNGIELVQCIVGDSLLEPFWPTGTGCARGFLGVLDTAWFMRQWCRSQYPKLQIISQRETIFKILSQTKPESKMSVINKYTIDPTTRYGMKLKVKTIIPSKRVMHLYVHMTPSQDNAVPVDHTEAAQPDLKAPETATTSTDTQQHYTDSEEEEKRVTTLAKKRRTGTLNSKQLLAFYQHKLAPFSDVVEVKDLNRSWVSGLALCALVQCYRPDMIDIHDMTDTDTATNLQIAFMLIEQEFGVSPMFSAEEVAQRGDVDKLAMLSYLAQIRHVVEDSQPVSKMPKLETPQEEAEEHHDEFLNLDSTNDTENSVSEKRPEDTPMIGNDFSSLSPRGTLAKISQSTVMQDFKHHVENAKVWLDEDSASDMKSPERRESMRRALLMSTNQMPGKLKKSGEDKRNLTRKKVLFREAPPSVHKFRYRESQDIDVGGSYTSPPPQLLADTPTLLASGAYDNATEDVQDKSKPPCGRPSLMHCRGIAQNRIKRLQQSFAEPSEDTSIAEEIAEETESGGATGSNDELSVTTETAESTAAEATPQNKHRKPKVKSKSNLKSKIKDLFKKEDTSGNTAVFYSDYPEETSNGCDDTGDDPFMSLKHLTNSHKVTNPVYQKKKQKKVLPDHIVEEDTSEAGSNVCCICEKKLYLIERYSAHGKFFHKTCYRCSTCNTMLRLGNSLLKKLPNNKVQFFCIAHAYTAGVFDVEWEGKDPKTKAVNGDDEISDLQEVDLSDDKEEQRESTTDYHVSEEDSDAADDEEDDDDEFEAAVATNLQKARQTMRSQKSIRLLVADEIQRGLDQVDEAEEELEKEGHDVEEKLRNRQSAAADDEVMEEWLEVLRKKKELVDKESKLMLKKKLQELHDRQNRLQLMLGSLGVGADADQGVQSEMKALEQDTEDLELELECLVTQMKSLSVFLEGESMV